MTSLQQLQGIFMDALFKEPDNIAITQLGEFLSDNKQLTAEEQITIYRNSVLGCMIGALRNPPSNRTAAYTAAVPLPVFRPPVLSLAPPPLSIAAWRGSVDQSHSMILSPGTTIGLVAQSRAMICPLPNHA